MRNGLTLWLAIGACASSSTESHELSKVNWEIWTRIDTHFGMRELDRVRAPATQKSDTCSPVKATSTLPRFGEIVNAAIEEHLFKNQIQMGGIAKKFYGVPNEDNALIVTLTSHPMCTVTQEGLTEVLNRVPPQEVIDKANQFATQYNQIRNHMIGGDKNALAEMKQLWLRLMGCLSYVESLTTADDLPSQIVAQTYGPSGYLKPEGVKWYIDSAQQDAASRLNIGLFQFAPTAGGNISPCRLAWSKSYPSCGIPPSSTTEDFKFIFGSSHQSFNAYCGVNKVLQSFFTQVNTTLATGVYPSNKDTNQKLRAPAQRCVTLHIRAGRAYNHFGPFQNSTGTNLNKLLTCALNP